MISNDTQNILKYPEKATTEKDVIAWKNRVKEYKDAEAARNVALYYGEIDQLEDSIKWTRIAAELGSLEAFHDMYVLLVAEDNWNYSNDEALIWLKKAADNGHKVAKETIKKQYPHLFAK